MKKRYIFALLCLLVCVLMNGVNANAEETIRVLQVRGICDDLEEEEPVYHYEADVYSGTTKCSGVINENPDDWQYSLSFEADNNTTILIDQSDIIFGVMRAVGDWEVIIDDMDECVLSHYTNKLSTNVVVPSTLRIDGKKYDVTGVLPGCFVDMNDLTEVDFGKLEINPNTFVNCPNLKHLKSMEYENSGMISDGFPEPFHIGKLKNKVTVEIPFSFTWMYYEEDDSVDEVGVERYCLKYKEEYVYKDNSKTVQGKDGWSYRADYNCKIAVITEYCDNQEMVSVPQTVTFISQNESYLCDVIGVKERTFNGTKSPAIREIDLGELPIVGNMCVNCPNLTRISSESYSMELYKAVVLNDQPKDNTLTIAAFNVSWENGDTMMDMESYCLKYKYLFENKSGDSDDDNIFLTIGNDMTVSFEALAGCTYKGNVNFIYDEDDYYLADDRIKNKLSNVKWSCASDSVIVTDSGEVSISPYAQEENATIAVSFEFEGKKYSFTNVIELLPRVKRINRNYQVVSGRETGVQLEYKLYDLDLGWGDVDEISLPEDATCSFEVIAGDIEVDENGYVRAKKNAKDGTATVEMTINGKFNGTTGAYDYIERYDIKVKSSSSSERPSEEVVVGTEKILIYGYAGSGAKEQVERFISTLPENQKKLVQYQEYDATEMNSLHFDYKYTEELDKMMASNQKPDVVLLPGTVLGSELGKKDIVALSDIGFEDSEYEMAYPYTIARGTNNGKLKAVTWEANPGCFVYNKQNALTVFGSDKPEVVQQKVKDWETLYNTAKLCREKEMNLLNNPNEVNPIFHSKNMVSMDEDTLYLNNMLGDYFDLQMKLVQEGAVSDDDQMWEDGVNYLSFDSYVGCLADARVALNLDEKYDVCQGPVSYEGSYSNYFAATDKQSNNGLVVLFLRSVLDNKHAMETMQYMANNQDFNRDNTDLNSKLKQLDYIATEVPATRGPIIEQSMIERLLTNGYEYQNWHNVYNSKNEGINAVIEDINWTTGINYIELGKNPAEQVKTHKFSNEWTVDIQPTCSKPGSKSKHCTDKGCKEKKDITAIPATGKHTYGAWKVTKAATCSQAGEKEHVCSVCKKVEKQAIPATGYVVSGTFESKNSRYVILSVKGKKGTVAWNGTVKAKGSVTIPKTVKGGGITFTVTEIKAKACAKNKSIKSVTIPAGVKTIGADAFNGASKLKTIKIKSTVLKKVGKNAIKGINKKAQIKVPKKKVKAYKKLFKKKTGFTKSMKIK